jgi:hypothetical protein
MAYGFWPPPEGPVDFTQVQAMAKQHGAVEILGPPPFEPA